MAAAGVAYHVGREANAVYGETLNGVQPKLNVKNHRFTQAGRSVREAGRPDVRPAVGHSSERRCRPTAAATAACRPIATDCARPTCRRIAAPGRSRPTTTSRATSCCCATSKPAIIACRGTRSGCPIARPTRTTTTRSRPTTSAATTTTRKPTTRRARESSPTTARISRACCGRSPIISACRRRCATSSSGSAWRRMSSSTTTTGPRSSTCAKRGG